MKNTLKAMFTVVQEGAPYKWALSTAASIKEAKVALDLADDGKAVQEARKEAKAANYRLQVRLQGSMGTAPVIASRKRAA